MGLKILHSADWHLDSPFTGFDESQRMLLKQAQKAIPGKVAQLCRRERCDLVLLAGDIFDGEATRDTVEIVKKALSDCGVPVLIAPGNHDFCAPGSVWLEEAWPDNVHVFLGGMEAVTLPELNCRVYGAGYQSMDCGALLENFRAEGNERYAIAVLHGDPAQKNSPYCPITAAQVRDSGLDYLALGHIHKAGMFRAGATLCAWPGCPMGRGWDETGEKGVCIVTLGQSADIRAVTLDTPHFYQQKVDISGGAEIALDKVLPAAGSGDFFRITLTGSPEADVAALLRTYSRIPNLEFRDETQPPLDIWGDTGADTLEGVYFRLLRERAEAGDDAAALAARISRELLMGKEVALP